jgi:LytS/YehU family sensor histidine kinase
LQVLVENAIKHNAVTSSSPLHIYIGVSHNNELVVKNEVRPKVSKEEGAGIALQNIQRRYALLTKKPMWYGIAGNEYIVKLPLL